MSRHRKRPAFRLQAQAHGSQPAAEWSGRRFGAALRRVIVSPTFAAGLGIVAAAMLVLPRTGSIFHYTLPRGGESATCPRVVCPTPAGGGGHAAIKGGKQIKVDHPFRHRAAPAASARATPSADPPPSPSPPSRRTLSYHTLRQWPGGFIGEITIVLSPGPVTRGWQLRFGYPSSVIDTVWGGGTWVRHGEHRAQVIAGPSASASAGQPIDVVFEASGNPSPPAHCTFNGKACRLGS